MSATAQQLYQQQLESIILAGEELNFRRAAARQGISEATLRRVIAAQEAKLGYALFQRAGRGLRLTPGGIEFLQHARRQLLRELSGAAKQAEQRPLLVGYSPHVNPALLVWLRRQYAIQRQSCRTLSLGSLEQAGLVRDGWLDAGLVLCPLAAVGVKIAPSFCEALQVALPARHALARAERPLEIAELRGLPMIGLAQHLHRPLAARFQQICRRHGLEPEIAGEALHISEAIAQVAAGKGFCFARGCDQRFAGPGAAFRPLAGTPAVILTGILFRHGAELPMLGEAISIA